MYTMHTRVLRARRQARLTQIQLAEKIGVHRSAVAQWERVDGTSPSVRHLEQIAILTGVHFEWLATGRGPPRPPEGALDPTLDMHDFARSENESRMLECARRLSPSQQRIACGILELLARQRGT